MSFPVLVLGTSLGLLQEHYVLTISSIPFSFLMYFYVCVSVYARMHVVPTDATRVHHSPGTGARCGSEEGRGQTASPALLCTPASQLAGKTPRLSQGRFRPGHGGASPEVCTG